MWINLQLFMGERKGATRQIAGVNVADFNPIRWKSQYFDNESGFYYIDGRYYSPAIRQFVSPVTPESAFFNATVVDSLYPYSLTAAYGVSNPLEVPPYSATIETSVPLEWDSPELTGWQSFWHGVASWWNRLGTGGQIAIGVSAALVTIAMAVATWGGSLRNH